MRLCRFWLLVAILAPACGGQGPQLYFFYFPSAAAGRAVHEQAVAALEAAGWWDFVRSNADRIEYHNVELLDPPRERAAGYATIEGRSRVMVVAVRGRSAREVGRIMAHEAGHLEHWRRYGRFDEDESWAKMRERQFLNSQTPGPIGGFNRLLAWLMFPAMAFILICLYVLWEAVIEPALEGPSYSSARPRSY